MASGLGCGDGRWSLCFSSVGGQDSLTTAGIRRGEPLRGLVPLGHEDPGILCRKRPRVVDESKTASLGENSPVLVTAHLLIVKEKKMAFWCYTSAM